jgi:hypothetical protein
VPPGARLARAKPVLVAAGKANLAKPGSGRVTVVLTAPGKKLLRAAKHLTRAAKGSFRLAGSSAVAARRAISVRR